MIKVEIKKLCFTHDINKPLGLECRVSIDTDREVVAFSFEDEEIHIIDLNMYEKYFTVEVDGSLEPNANALLYYHVTK